MTAHTDWCEQNHGRDGVWKCVWAVGKVQGVHVYVSGLYGDPPQVLVDSNGALVRFEVGDARVLHGLIGKAIEVAAAEVEPAEVEP